MLAAVVSLLQFYCCDRHHYFSASTPLWLQRAPLLFDCYNFLLPSIISAVPLLQVHSCFNHVSTMSMILGFAFCAGVETRKADKKSVLIVPRMATLDWLRAVERGMEWGCGKTFKDFDNRNMLAEALVEEQLVVLPKKSSSQPYGLPTLLSLCSDQQSIQMCGLSFLDHHHKLSMVHWNDPHHASWNDILEATCKAGFAACVEASLVVYNCAYGPYQKAAWFNDLRDGVGSRCSKIFFGHSTHIPPAQHDITFVFLICGSCRLLLFFLGGVAQ